MTALSPNELALLRLMAEVGVPLREGQYGQLFFPGRQMTRIGARADFRLIELMRAGWIEQRRPERAPSWALDYILTDKGRQLVREKFAKPELHPALRKEQEA